MIESDTTEPWSVLDAELSPFLACKISDTAIATGAATEFTSSSTNGDALNVSSNLGDSIDGFTSVVASESLYTKACSKELV